MGARRGLCMLTAAAALAAALHPAAPRPALALHDTAPKGEYWTAGAYAPTQWKHTNQWECVGKEKTKPGTGEKYNVQCERRTLGDSGQVLEAAEHGTVHTVFCIVYEENGGCGHSGIVDPNWAWRWKSTPGGPLNGHSVANAEVSNSYVCTVGGATISGVTSQAHCGTWTECRDGTLTGGVPPTGCAPCPDGQIPNADWSACEDPPGEEEPEPCAADGSEHRHDGGECGPDHSPPGCLDAVAEGETGQYPDHVGPAADGHRAAVPGCPDYVPTVACAAGEHRHAAAAGGHTGCRAAHSAPSCTWSSTLTWSPGHGGAAGDGHSTTTGMRRCTSARTFCASAGPGALSETVSRQRPGAGFPDNLGLLGPGYHRDRVPYGGNMSHAQFTPSLTVAGVASPSQVRLAPGEWETLSYTTPAAASGSIGAVAYDYDAHTPRWRSCGQVTWTRTLTASIDAALETSGGRFRFPAGDCPTGVHFVDLTATWRVHFDSLGGAANDVTETNARSTRWLIRCAPPSSAGVAGVCDRLDDAERADLAFRSVAAPVGVWLAADHFLSDHYATVPDYAPPVLIPDDLPRKWAPARTGAGGPWRTDGAPGSAALIWASANGTATITASAANPRDGTVHDCGPVAFRMVSMTWTAGASGDGARRRPITADSPKPLRGVHHITNAPRTFKRYAMNADDAASVLPPITCTAAWPVPAGGGWDPWTPTYDEPDGVPASAKAARDASLAACTGRAFWEPVTSTYTTSDGERACAQGPVDITLASRWEAGKLKDGQPDRAHSWTRGTRWERIRGWTATRTVTAVVFDYWRCPAPGI